VLPTIAAAPSSRIRCNHCRASHLVSFRVRATVPHMDFP
jgi:hypothetical protein